MFRGSDGEIREEAEERKPLCVSTGLPGTAIIPPYLLWKAATFARVLSGSTCVCLAGDRWGMPGGFLLVGVGPSQRWRIMKAERCPHPPHSKKLLVHIFL